MAFGIAGSVCALAGAGANLGGAAQGAASVAETVTKASVSVVQGLSEVAQGASAIGSSRFQADATDRGADAKQAQQAIALLTQLAKWVVDGVKETDDSHERALQTLSGAIQTQAQTLVIASARV
jgi:hypothetical protein